MKLKVVMCTPDSRKAVVFDMNDPLLLAEFAERQDDYPLTLEALKEFIIDMAVDVNTFDGDILVEVVADSKYAYQSDKVYCTEFCSPKVGTWIRIPDGDGFTCPTCKRVVSA